MVVSRRLEVAARWRGVRLQGYSRDSFARYRSTTPSWRYEIIAPGFKYNLTDIASAIGIHQLRRVEEMHARRAAIVAQYDAAFVGLLCVPPPQPEPGDVHAWHLYVVQLGED